MISADIVEKTWQEIGSLTVTDAQSLGTQFAEEQPVALAYIQAALDASFEQYEIETIFYIGVVVWQIMKRHERRLLKVTRRKMDRAIDENDEILDFLADDTEADFYTAVQTMLETYPEPEVLRYIVEALMEEVNDPDDPAIRDEYIGLAFIHLKTLLDAFITSLAR